MLGESSGVGRKVFGAGPHPARRVPDPRVEEVEPGGREEVLAGAACQSGDVKTDEHVLQELVAGFHGRDRDADLAGANTRAPRPVGRLNPTSARAGRAPDGGPGLQPRKAFDDRDANLEPDPVPGPAGETEPDLAPDALEPVIVDRGAGRAASPGADRPVPRPRRGAGTGTGCPVRPASRNGKSRYEHPFLRSISFSTVREKIAGARR